MSVDPRKLRPVARPGGTAYSRVLEGFDVERTSWKDVSPAAVGASNTIEALIEAMTAGL
ncbi:hypothetical protein B0H15DRAFT_849300 [Mycena belliarum]|uniref:Uncharacterized protein n=1 Tax=Mycena belliarum TaxID=1033014 RepID=A0AAD6U4L1_9AGAR|nr:hypothetical protein B0H15DRAFT_849300 [Mycena belliae]